MNALESVLKEERDRLKELEKAYLREIKKLQRGSIQKKCIKGIVYPYLVVSFKGKVDYRCLNKLGREELQKLKEEIALRKKYQALLKETRKNMRTVKKVLRGKKQTS